MRPVLVPAAVAPRLLHVQLTVLRCSLQEKRGCSGREAEGEEEPNTSLFPLFPLSDSSLQGNSKGPQWLSNTSFTTDLSVVEDAVTTRYNVTLDEDEGDADEHPPKPSPSYEMLDSSTSDRGRDEETKHERRGRRKKKKKKRSREVKLDDFTSRKSGIRAWAGSDTRPSKDYYVDSRGDRDNLAFGSLYRMDVARYKLYNSSRSSEFQDLYRQKRWDSILDKEADIDALDGKLKYGGRYWSAKYSALERHKDLKRIRIIALDKSVIVPGEFIPLIELQPSRDGRDSASLGRSWICEESWEEEVLRRTREFNKMSQINDELPVVAVFVFNGFFSRALHTNL